MPAPWPEAQAAFAAALANARLPPPAGLGEPAVADPGRRFAVHRNNAYSGLINALQERFPVTSRLVGNDFFRAMARAFVAERLPRSPLLMTYGDDLADFIGNFAPAAGIPYLPDVARLEQAWSEAYHAPEATPLPADSLAALPPETLIDARFALHPSTRILRSSHPIVDIWSAHQGQDVVVAPADWQPQDVLVVRPDADVLVVRLPAGLHAFIGALLRRRPVQDAAGIAAREHSEFDVGEGVVMLFRLGVVVAVDTGGSQES